MWKWLLAAALGPILTVIPAQAAADTDTGNALLKLCRAGKSGNATGYAYCLGYTLGVSDVARRAGVQGKRYCPHGEVTSGQTMGVVTVWLERHPELLHLAAYILITEALSEAFPCKK